MTTPKAPPGYSKPMTDAYDPYADDPTVGLEESSETTTWEDDTAIAGDDGYGGDAALDSYDPLSDEDPEAGLSQLESGSVPEPPPPSQEEMLAKIEGMEELLQEFKKDLPKPLIKEIKEKLKELKKLVGNEKTFAYSLAYITADLDDIQIKILDAATGGLKDSYKEAKDKIDDVEDKIDATTDLAPGVKEDLLKRIDDAEDQLKEDPSDETITSVLAAVNQIEQELDTAIEAPYANNTKPTKVNGTTATYEATDVDLTVNFDNEITTHQIYASGTVTIHPSSQKDTVEGSYDPSKQLWTLKINKNGNQQESKIIYIHGPENTNVVLDITNSEQITNPFYDYAGTDSLLDHVTIGLNGEAPVPFHPSLEALRQVTGNGPKGGHGSKKSFLDSLYNFYPEFDTNGNGKLSVTEANQAIENGLFPPKVPNATLLRFLVKLDSNLEHTLTIFDGKKSDDNYADVRNRLLTLLEKVYIGTGIEIREEGASGNSSDNIIFDGTIYDVIDQDQDGNLAGYLVFRA
ncbi:MAG: hypothetical protein HYU97_03490 [Deltaproteobacteria bacterium]|nr:hypothetical protein [Deltaproteobacteria bacterium]